MQVSTLARPTPTKAPENGVHEFPLRNVDRSQQHPNGPPVDGIHEATTCLGVVCGLHQVVFDGLKRWWAVASPVPMWMAGIIAEAVDDGDATAKRELNDSHDYDDRSVFGLSSVVPDKSISI